MKRTTIRKVTALGVGLSLLAAGLAAAGNAAGAEKICTRMYEGFPFTYPCPDDPNGPPQYPPPPPPPVPAPVVSTNTVLLTRAATVSGPVTVSVSAKLTDLRGVVRKSAPVILCWKSVTASKESCVARNTNSAGVAAVAVSVSTLTTVRAVTNKTANFGASKSASAVVRVAPKVTVTAKVRSLTVSVNPASRVKVIVQKKVGSRYVNVRVVYTSTRGAFTFGSLTRGATYRVYVYASGGRDAAYSRPVRVP